MKASDWTNITFPKKLLDIVKKEVDTKGLWTSPSEYIRDAVKAKLNIYNLRLKS